MCTTVSGNQKEKGMAGTCGEVGWADESIFNRVGGRVIDELDKRHLEGSIPWMAGIDLSLSSPVSLDLSGVTPKGIYVAIWSGMPRRKSEWNFAKSMTYNAAFNGEMAARPAFVMFSAAPLMARNPSIGSTRNRCNRF
jgi:hypothetical protein